jgi:hypothetical protein
MVCLRDFPVSIKTLFAGPSPIAYDISNQVFQAYGKDRVVGDMEKLAPGTSAKYWYGGEFLCGAPHFYRELVLKVDVIWPRYNQVWRELHHQGDEMLVSVALNQIGCIARANDDFAVFRYWSGRIRHQQLPMLDVLERCALLHLPQDKDFLAALGLQNGNFSIARQNRQIRTHLFGRIIRRSMAVAWHAVKRLYR